MAFCDFCDCDNCKTGIGLPGLKHAQTSDGRWICDVCFIYDECIRQKRQQQGIRKGGPCDNKNCEHRPSIVSKWKGRDE